MLIVSISDCHKLYLLQNVISNTFYLTVYFFTPGKKEHCNLSCLKNPIFKSVLIFLQHQTEYQVILVDWLELGRVAFDVGSNAINKVLLGRFKCNLVKKSPGSF